MTAARLSTQARRELVAASKWISRDSPRAVHALADTIEAMLVRIAAFPESGSLRPNLTDRPVRFFEVHGFPYVMVVAAAETPPAVLHILHTSRDVKALLGG